MEETKTLGIRLNSKDYRALEAIARMNERAISQEARFVLKAHIRKSQTESAPTS